MELWSFILDRNVACDFYEDNQAAIRFVQGQTLTERTRHIHREDSAIRELQRNKEINIQYINTAYNLADFFTKILPMTTFLPQLP